MRDLCIEPSPLEARKADLEIRRGSTLWVTRMLLFQNEAVIFKWVYIISFQSIQDNRRYWKEGTSHCAFHTSSLKETRESLLFPFAFVIRYAQLQFLVASLHIQSSLHRLGTSYGTCSDDSSFSLFSSSFLLSSSIAWSASLTPVVSMQSIISWNRASIRASHSWYKSRI